MSFHGDANQISIANIVQALFLNGQQGVLVVESDTLERRMQISQAGLRPLLNAPDDLSILRHAILKERLLNANQFDNALSGWDPDSLYPGEFLVRRRVIEEECVGAEIRRQLEESVFEIFTAKNLQYTFSANADSSAYEIFDPEGLGSQIILNVNGLLMESVRREDEWQRIQEELPSSYEVFTPLDKGLPSECPADIDLPDETYEEIVELVNGERSIARMVEESVLSRYAMFQALFQLKERGYVRSLRLQEKNALATKMRRMVRSREALDIYRSIIDEQPDNVDIRIQLIFLLEKSDEPIHELVDQYLCLVDHFEGTEPDKAKGYVEKILALDSDHLEAYERLFTIQANENNRGAAMGTLRLFLKAVRRKEAYEVGAEVLSRLVDFYPEEAHIYHELADLLIASNQNDRAVSSLKSAAQIYDANDDHQRLVKTYELIARIDPSQYPVLRKLAAESRQRSITTAHLVKIGAATGILLTIACVIFYFILIELDSRRVYAETEKLAHEQMKYGEFDRARATVSDFLNAYWFSTQRKTAAELYSNTQSYERQRSEEISRFQAALTVKLSTLYAKAGQKLKDNDYTGAAEILRFAVTETEREKLGQVQRDHVQRIQSRLAEVEAYLERARGLATASRQALEQTDIARAHALARELYEHFPHSPEAKTIRLPVSIETIPRGAKVTILGKEYSTPTPILLSFPPLGRITVDFDLNGYRSTTSTFSPRKTSKFVQKLEKLPIWEFESGGPIDGYSAVWNGAACFGNRNGRIFCVNEEGKKRWSEIETHMDVSGGIGAWKDVFYAGNFEGRVFLINAKTGRLKVKPYQAAPRGHAIKEAPSEATEKGLVAFNCGNRVVSGIRLTSSQGRPEWLFASPAQLSGSPVLDRGKLYVFTTDGHLLELDPETTDHRKRLRKRFELNGIPAHPGIVDSGRAYVALTSAEIICLDLRSAKTDWRVPLPSTATAEATVAADGEALLVPLASGELACLDAKTGEVAWRADPRERIVETNPELAEMEIGPIETRGVAAHGTYYVGTKAGFLLAWDIETGALEWHFVTRGATEDPPKGILCAGAISGNRLIQGSDDGVLYCLDTSTGEPVEPRD